MLSLFNEINLGNIFLKFLNLKSFQLRVIIKELILEFVAKLILVSKNCHKTTSLFVKLLTKYIKNII